MIRDLSIIKKGDYKQVLFLLVVTFAILGIAQDLWHAHLKNYHFYWYESLLFKSYWLYFFPVIWKITEQSIPKSKMRIVSNVLIISVSQLMIATFIIDLFAKTFFYAPFRWQNILNYLFKQHFVETLLIYGTTFALITFRNRTTKEPFQAKSITVTKDKTRIPIKVEEILFIQTNRPYITIHTLEQHYLSSTTLKQVLATFNNTNLVRIHKSTVINLQYVKSYTSRQNGDYDVLMENGTTLRLSRTYTRIFKERMVATQLSS